MSDPEYSEALTYVQRRRQRDPGSLSEGDFAIIRAWLGPDEEASARAAQHKAAPPLLETAYSVWTVKSVDVAERRIRGIASTPSPDRTNDIVLPLGATFRNPVPLLYEHDRQAPVGTVRFDPPTASGVTFEATLPVVTQPGAVRDLVDRVWTMLKSGLLRGVSIGFRALADGVVNLPSGGRKIRAFEICELSLVSIPANVDCTVLEVKRYDQRARQAAPPVLLDHRVARLEQRRQQLEVTLLTVEQKSLLYQALAQDDRCIREHVRSLAQQMIAKGESQDFVAEVVDAMLTDYLHEQQDLLRRKMMDEFLGRPAAVSWAKNRAGRRVLLVERGE